jgi:hypothetical protein
VASRQGTATSTAGRRPIRWVVDIALRGVAFSLFWAVLNRGAVDSWVLGAPLVVIATALSLVVVPAAQHRIAAALTWRCVCSGLPCPSTLA